MKKEEVYLRRSPRAGKKWQVEDTEHNKKVNFGAVGYQDYTMHHDENRKKNYISRHERNENWKDWHTAGFWSRWLLWNEPSIEKSIEIIEAKFPVKVKRSKKKDGRSRKKKKKSPDGLNFKSIVLKGMRLGAQLNKLSIPQDPIVPPAPVQPPVLTLPSQY